MSRCANVATSERQIMTTDPKEIYCLEDRASPLGSNLAQEDDGEAAEDDDEARRSQVSRGHDDYRASSSQHRLVHVHQHAPNCKLVSTELGTSQPSRYLHQPHCLHSHQHHLHHLHHQHKPNCALHGSNQPLGSNQKLFKSLIAQQHVQLSAATMKQPPHAQSVAADPSGRLQSSAHRHHHNHQTHHHQMRYLKSPSADKSKYLLVEYQGPDSNRASQSGDSNNGHHTRSNIRHVRATDPQAHHHHQHHSAATVAAAAAAVAQSGIGEQRANKTTINFIAQLYFLIHLSAMISLLLHHKNLVSNESRADDGAQQTITMQQLSSQEQQQQQQSYAPTRRSSHVALPPLRHANHNDMHRQRPAEPAVGNASDDGPVPSPPPPALPVPQMLRFEQFHHHELTGAPGDTTSGRPARSIFAADPSAHSLDARSPDILVRLVGRTHAKSALQYFLCYLLSSSITVLVFLWLVRVCSAAGEVKRRQELAVYRGSRASRVRDTRAARLVETRQDCTPVLIGSISLGLIQLIVIGLDIADNIDWLTSDGGSGHSAPLGPTWANLEQPRGQWPIFVPLLQFVFVSLLMQYILAKVARIRGLIKLPGSGQNEEGEEEEDDEDEDESDEGQQQDERSRHRRQRRRREGRLRAVPVRRAERRSKSLSDNLQNIALAHLLVTHILLWLMKLNSISLFHGVELHHHHQHHQQQQVFVPFVMSPPPPPQPPRSVPSEHAPASTTTSATTQSTAQQETTTTTTTPRTTAPSSTAAHDILGGGNGGAPPSRSPAAPDQSERNNGSGAPPPQADERPRREKVLLSSLRNANLLADNHLNAPAKQPQLVIVAASRPLNDDVSHSATSTTQRPTTRAILDDERERNERELKLMALLRPALPPPLVAGTTSTTRAPPPSTPPMQTTTRASLEHLAPPAPAANNGAKNERDLQPASKRRPLAPEILGSEADDDRPSGPFGLEPVRVAVSERPRQRVAFSPGDDGATSSDASTTARPSPPPALELKPANISASLFKSSLPKRMTAFRQGRPSQRVNLAATTSRPASTPATTTTSTSPSSSTTWVPNLSAGSTSERKFSLKSHAAGSKVAGHKVRVIVDREQSFPRSIDLTAVIPASSLQTASDEDEASRDNEIDGQHGGPPKTTERPFPSVDDDPPPSTRRTTAADQVREREPNESVALANQTKVSSPVVVVGGDGLSTTTSARPLATTTTTVAPPVAAGEEADQPVDEGEEESPGGDEEGAELDLDALLPPVPNYNDTTTTVEGDGSSQSDEEALRALDNEEPRRRPRKMRPANATDMKQALLDEAAFVFDEAASSAPVANVTLKPVSASNGTNRANLTHADLAQANTTAHRLEAVGREALTMQTNHSQSKGQQPHQHQPSFTDFLLPIVQQYHILVLTILFNMWLDSMQQQQQQRQSGKETQEGDSRHTQQTILMMVRRDNKLAEPSRRRSAPKRHVPDRSSSSSRDLSPVVSSGVSSASAVLGGRSLSEADLLAPESSSMSRGSSTKQLVSAVELAVRHKQRARQLSRSANLPAGGGTRRLGRSANGPLVVAARHNRAARRNVPERSPGETSSSVCSVFFGLLVVSGSLIVILLGVDLLSLLVQCAIQLISIAICLAGLCIVWRIRRSARASRQLEARRARHKAKAANRILQTTTTTTTSSHTPQAPAGQLEAAISHKSSFHYLFLLAAYYCGISVALNLGQQHQIQRLFPPPVAQFVQRLVGVPRPLQDLDDSGSSPLLGNQTTLVLNLQLLFYCALSLKGLVLIVQVTCQTILIRSSWRWSSARAELRQIYTFLMFTNLSLWALEICDQQQQMLLVKQQQQQHQLALQVAGGWPGGGGGGGGGGHQQQHLVASNFELLTLEGFTRFAGSVVTLSHLYHGLVFMQH